MPRPFFGAVKLPGDARDIGKRCDYLERFLRDLYKSLQPDGGISHFFLEEQHLGTVAGGEKGGKRQPRRTIPPATIKMLAGLSATAQKFAYQVMQPDVKTNCYEVNIAEWRKHFLGKGTGFKARGEDPKELSIQRCTQYGWYTNQPDSAEACGILDYSLTMIPGYVRPWRDNALMGGIR